MKTVSLDSKSVTLEQLIEQAARGEVVFLTSQGQTLYALVPADDGDQEICALRSNSEFMAYLTDAEQRGQTKPRKSLQEIRNQYDAETAKSAS